MSNVVVFDLDGVITSEHAYWDTAGLVIHELLYSPRYWNITGVTNYVPITSAEESRRVSRATFPQEVIIGLKARSVNSNWDTCYVGMCVCLIALLAELYDCSMLLPLQPSDEQWIALFRRQLAAQRGYKALDPTVFQRLHDTIFRGVIGLDLMNRFDAYASSVLGHPIEGVFGRYSPSWKFCADLFQAWYLGDELYMSNYAHAPAQAGKAGCIRFEQPLLPIAQLRATLEGLRERGYVLGVATGRPGQEAILPLKNYGLYDYFDEQRIVTHAEVAQAEAVLRKRGDRTSLVKPHPYQFVRAADPAYQPGMKLPARDSFIVVGDTPSDVLGAHAANALVVAVLTGAITPEARSLLERSQPDFLIEDVTSLVKLLEQIEDLGMIQRMQFQEKARAELLLQRWFMRHMNLSVERVTLVPKPVSLNSFNGFYSVDGKEYFFKTHVEEQGILHEYYHAELLSKASYNVVQPLRTLHERNRQMVVYPVVRWPVIFDLMRAVETDQAEQAQADTLIAAEKYECERLLSIYEETLASSTAQEHASAPIHQLFWHRLTGGRYQQFYAGKQILLPGQNDKQEKRAIAFSELLRYRWVVN
ncbi:MAG TPA: HAD family hydrolase, partial [Ktedonobacteraceae bacterium]